MDQSLLGGAQSEQPATGTEQVNEVLQTFTPPEWAKGINVGEDILKAPMFSSIKSIDDVVKGYYNAQKMVGADKIVVPTKNSSPEEWKNYYIKAGLPSKLEEYKVELPKAFDNQDFNAEFIKAAYENNVRPDQLQKLTELYQNYNDKIVSEYEATQAQSLEQTVNELKQEWGQGFDKQIATANRVIKHFGGEELHKQILGSELANNKEFLKLMAGIGSKMTGEDSFQNNAVATFGMTKDEARSKMNAIYGDMGSPYFNSQHAQHKEFLDNMLKYQEIISGN